MAAPEGFEAPDFEADKRLLVDLAEIDLEGGAGDADRLRLQRAVQLRGTVRNAAGAMGRQHEAVHPARAVLSAVPSSVCA